MPATTWGMLPKNQEDPETIEEAIARIVGEHNEDNEAHLAEGQSLQSHKAAEIIDHLIHSVKLNNLERNLFNKTIIASSFQSLDGFDVVSAETQFSLAGLWINTSTALDNLAYCASNETEGLNIDWEKNPVLDLALSFRLGTNHDIFFGLGDHILTSDGPFCGFKIINGTLSACVWDEDGANDEEEEISGITLTDFNKYHIEFISGEGAKFYINDELKAELNYTEINPSLGRHFYLVMYNRTAGQHLEAIIKPFSYSENN
jgi:hypothetical protein